MPAQPHLIEAFDGSRQEGIVTTRGAEGPQDEEFQIRSGDPASTPALSLCGGVALYLLAHVALRLRIGGGLGRGRPVATILLLALLPIATKVSALTALGLVGGRVPGL
jgi:hypothetical protein